MSYISCFLLASFAVGTFASGYPGYTSASGNCPGNVILEQHVPAQSKCADMCNGHTECKSFSISNNPLSDGQFLCILKSLDNCNTPDTTSDFSFHSKTKQAFGFFDPLGDVAPWYAPPAYPAPAPVPYGGYYYGTVPGFQRANGNCQGNFLSGVLALPLEQCAANCVSTPGCAGFSFNFHAPYPQCILKAASCPYPDPGAVFTFFAKNGYQGAFAPTYYQYYPDIYVPDYPAFPVYTPWVKSARRFFKESGELCSGRILRNPEDMDLDKCADACLADRNCTGFSFDNFAKSSPFSCTLRAEACQSRANSTRWSYFERQPAADAKWPVDADYLHALESSVQPAMSQQQVKEEPAQYNSQYKPMSFFDMQKFFALRTAAPAHTAPSDAEMKRL